MLHPVVGVGKLSVFLHQGGDVLKDGSELKVRLGPQLAWSGWRVRVRRPRLDRGLDRLRLRARGRGLSVLQRRQPKVKSQLKGYCSISEPVELSGWYRAR